MSFGLVARQKIDPELMQTIRSMGNEKINVIIYCLDERDYKKTIEKMGAKIKKELSLIRGYAAEVPQEKLMNLAALDQVEYIAADIAAKTQMDIGPKK